MAPVPPEFTFPRFYQAEILDRLPMLIEEPRQLVFPKRVEEVERGALIVRVRPQTRKQWVGIFARGFDSERAITGLFSTPHADWLCAVSGGYAYLVNANQPEQWHFVKSRPVVEIRAAGHAAVLILADFQTISGFTSEARLWQTAPLSWEGLKISVFSGHELQGLGWDALQDRDIPFTVNLHTGEHAGGAAPKVTQHHSHLAG
jgi:hypothetical protein